MKLSFLILFLLILSGASQSGEIKSPSEGQKQSKPTDSKTDVANSLPTTSLTVVVNNPASENKETTAPKDPEHWPPLWAIVVTLIIGAVATGVALQTLGKIAEQAEAANQSVVATNKLVDLERPWIMIEANWPNDPANRSSPESECIEWSAVNAGRSPAFITRLSVKAEPLPYKLAEKRPKYPDADPFAEFIIAPNGGRHSSKYPFTFGAGPKGEYFRGQMCIAFYGLIEYQDSSKNPHVTRFCVYWFQQNGFSLYSPVGPPDWVEYT